MAFAIKVSLSTYIALIGLSYIKSLASSTTIMRGRPNENTQNQLPGIGKPSMNAMSCPRTTVMLCTPFFISQLFHMYVHNCLYTLFSCLLFIQRPSPTIDLTTQGIEPNPGPAELQPLLVVSARRSQVTAAFDHSIQNPPEPPARIREVGCPDSPIYSTTPGPLRSKLVNGKTAYCKPTCNHFDPKRRIIAGDDSAYGQYISRVAVAAPAPPADLTTEGIEPNPGPPKLRHSASEHDRRELLRRFKSPAGAKHHSTSYRNSGAAKAVAIAQEVGTGMPKTKKKIRDMLRHTSDPEMTRQALLHYTDQQTGLSGIVQRHAAKNLLPRRAMSDKKPSKVNPILRSSSAKKLKSALKTSRPASALTTEESKKYEYLVGIAGGRDSASEGQSSYRNLTENMGFTNKWRQSRDEAAAHAEIQKTLAERANRVGHPTLEEREIRGAASALNDAVGRGGMAGTQWREGLTSGSRESYNVHTMPASLGFDAAMAINERQTISREERAGLLKSDLRLIGKSSHKRVQHSPDHLESEGHFYLTQLRAPATSVSSSAKYITGIGTILDAYDLSVEGLFSRSSNLAYDAMQFSGFRPTSVELIFGHALGNANTGSIAVYHIPDAEVDVQEGSRLMDQVYSAKRFHNAQITDNWRFRLGKNDMRPIDAGPGDTGIYYTQSNDNYFNSEANMTLRKLSAGKIVIVVTNDITEWVGDATQANARLNLGSIQVKYKIHFYDRAPTPTDCVLNLRYVWNTSGNNVGAVAFPQTGMAVSGAANSNGFRLDTSLLDLPGQMPPRTTSTGAHYEGFIANPVMGTGMYLPPGYYRIAVWSASDQVESTSGRPTITITNGTSPPKYRGVTPPSIWMSNSFASSDANDGRVSWNMMFSNDNAGVHSLSFYCAPMGNNQITTYNGYLAVPEDDYYHTPWCNLMYAYGPSVVSKMWCFSISIFKITMPQGDTSSPIPRNALTTDVPWTLQHHHNPRRPRLAATPLTSPLSLTESTSEAKVEDDHCDTQSSVSAYDHIDDLFAKQLNLSDEEHRVLMSLIQKRERHPP